jgi:UDP-2,3-diacylglucosamine pyrophosphatase LpxH
MSDFHIGYKGFDARAALHCLQSHDCDILYLVGDIFDGWKMEKRWYWTQDYTDLMDEVIRKKKQGCKIIYITGNHDEKVRNMIFRPIRFALAKRYGFKIGEMFEHICANGKKFLVLHGDQFDSYIVRRISKFCDRVYEIFEGQTIKTIEDGQETRWSLGKEVAKGGKGLLDRFTKAAAKKALKEDVDGIVYGHSHVAEYVERKGKIFANCGSWTAKARNAKHHTCIVEETDGSITLVKWPMMRPKAKPKNIALRDIQAEFSETRHLIRVIHALWCQDEKTLLKASLKAMVHKKYTL